MTPGSDKASAGPSGRRADEAPTGTAVGAAAVVDPAGAAEADAETDDGAGDVDAEADGDAEGAAEEAALGAAGPALGPLPQPAHSAAASPTRAPTERAPIVCTMLSGLRHDDVKRSGHLNP